MTGRRIRLFVSDIDGCLAQPFTPFDLAGLGELRQRAGSARKDHSPQLTICSGRGFGYVEAIVQALDVELPVLFEAGGGMYDPRAYSIKWAPTNTKEEREQIQELVRLWDDEYRGDPDISVDVFKQTQASIVVQDPAKMVEMLDVIKASVRELSHSLVVADTPVSIDVFPNHLSKKSGVEWLSEVLDIGLDEMAFIGDSTGDIGAIQSVGLGMAPSNASNLVKESADYVCSGDHLDGVVEAFDLCLEHNISASRDG